MDEKNNNENSEFKNDTAKTDNAKIVIDALGNVKSDEVSSAEDIKVLQEKVNQKMKEETPLKENKKTLKKEPKEDELFKKVNELLDDEEVELSDDKNLKVDEKIQIAERLEEKIVDIAIKKNRNRIIIIIAVIATLVIMFFSTIFGIINIWNNKIQKNVYIDKINVGGLTKEEATKKISDIYKSKSEKEIKLKYDTLETPFKLKDIDFQVKDIEAVNEAYQIGRNSNIIVNNYNIIYQYIFGKTVNLEANYNPAYLSEIIKNVSAFLPNKVKNPEYQIDKEKSKLRIFAGEDGIDVNTKELEEKIISACKSTEDITAINIPIVKEKAPQIDLDKIYNEVKKEAQDASFNEKTKELKFEENGMDFGISLEEAKKLLLEKKKEYIIPLKIIKPKVTLEQLGQKTFPDLLGTYETQYDGTQVNRTTNLKIAVRRLNGYILRPGEEFSYNRIMGRSEHEYKSAAIFSAGRVVDELAGGICQISSTLYAAALKTNLEITQRTNHGFVTPYAKPGLDATVYFNAIDFRFKNNRKYPIKIVATISNGVTRVSFYGIKTEDVRVDLNPVLLSVTPRPVTERKDPNLAEGQKRVIQNGIDGRRVRVYKTVYINGVKQSTTVVSTDIYRPMAKIVAVGTKKKAGKTTKQEDSKKTEEPKKEEKKEEKKED